jgi:ribosomal protein S18 acetylase RimI-like enzyme
MKLEPCAEPFWEFVRTLRMDERVAGGFIEKADITPEQQKRYMAAHWQNYFVATIDGVPAGFIGSVDGDIRVCTHPDFQRRGIASFMLRELMRRFPDAVGKVKIENEASKKLFEANGFRPSYMIYEPAC